MEVRDFQGFPSLQEVECSGRTLRTQVDFLSITLFRLSDGRTLAKLKTGDNTCKTFVEYASCTLASGDRRNSVVRTLVSDFPSGRSVSIGCNITGVVDSGHAHIFSWIIHAEKGSK